MMLGPAMTQEAANFSAPGGGFRLLPLIAVVAGVAVLVTLGFWQVQRLQWKTHMLASIAALQSAPPEPLDVVLNRLPDHDSEVDFVRVQARCPSLQTSATLRLYSILDGVMGDRLITACPIHAGVYGSVLVDRGFVPADRAAEIKPGPIIDAPIVGVLRKADPVSWLQPPNNVARNDWHSRDIVAMAAALHAPAPAPVYFMLESPAPPGFAPRPAPVPIHIANNHLGYALTWFGLALGLAGVYIGSLLHTSRRPVRS